MPTGNTRTCTAKNITIEFKSLTKTSTILGKSHRTTICSTISKIDNPGKIHFPNSKPNAKMKDQNTFWLPIQIRTFHQSKIFQLNKGVHAFPKGICPKVNVIARLEYEFAYYDSAVHRFNHYTTRTPHQI